MTRPHYTEIAAKKRALRDAEFLNHWLVPDEHLPSDDVKDVSGFIEKSGHLSSTELKITSSTLSEIVTNIALKKWTAVEVCEAFCHRASIAHQLTNCLSEVFFNAAIEDAGKLDRYFAETGKLVGPLHGIPIAMKDNFNIKGQATTVGMVSFCFKPEKFEEETALVLMLRDMGAIMYVKTNVPVAMMMPETNNHVYGNTTNPFNRLLSAGGSSGGGASLAALSNVVAVSTDIGGSIRIPASYLWVYSLKPTFGRFPTYGARSGLPGLELVNSINGPIATNLGSLEYYCKSIVEKEPWNYDPKMVEIPWRSVELPSRLTFAILEDDGWVRPTPPIIRGIRETKAKLLAAGHEVIEWDSKDHLRLSQIITAFFVSDGGVHVMNEVKESGEPLFPYMEMYGTTPEMKVSELWKLQAERTKLAKEYLDRWNETAAKTSTKRLDGIIMPATPFAGNPNGKFHDYVGYTSPFNLLDYSVGTFPVTRADSEMDKKEERLVFYSPTDENIWRDYDSEETHGGVVGLQLVGRKFQEEKIIQMLKVVSQL